MSEHVVHVGLLEDCFAFAQHLPVIPPDFAKVMGRQLAFARLGCITVAGDQFSFRLLEEIRPLWPKRDEIIEAKLAFVLGWISHRACDRQMKPIWNIAEMAPRGSDADPRISPTECSIYHEAELYNIYYKDDPKFRLAIFDDELKAYPCAELFDLDMARSYVESSLGVNMMDIQTFPPPPKGQRFIEDLCIRAQKFYVEISRYQGAIQNPDPGFVKAYVDDINWFCDGDMIIRAAMKLRGGGELSTEECLRAFETPASSHYGQALQLSLRYFIAAAEYIHDPTITQDVLKDRLDVGKLGRAGKPV